jgi:hypothetical protein
MPETNKIGNYCTKSMGVVVHIAECLFSLKPCKSITLSLLGETTQMANLKPGAYLGVQII